MIKVRFITYYFIFCWLIIKLTAYQKAKKTVRWVLGIVLGLYIGTILLLNIPSVQRQMSVFVANELASILDSKISIGRINIGLLNRIIIDDLLLDDQSGKEMLKVTRLSANSIFSPYSAAKYPSVTYNCSALTSI